MAAFTPSHPQPIHSTLAREVAQVDSVHGAWLWSVP
jgi:hypothetical protein